MCILTIIQARLSSTRAPGKVMRKVSGKPVLGFMIESLGQCREPFDLVVATSSEPEDDAIADYCTATGVACVRGDLNDVAGRYAAVLAQFPADAFVRLCGDSPFLDHRLVDRAIDLFRVGEQDIVTNVHPRSFPAGQSVEVIGTNSFLDGLGRMTEASDREHVTPYFYRHAGRYTIVNFAAQRNLSSVRLTVDSEKDFANFVSTVMRMTKPHWSYSYEDVLALSTGVLA